MKIPSQRTRRDMETAAELRAAGATWESIGVELRRQPTLIIRWARVYRDDWERMLQEAEERWAHLVTNESRSVLRNLLRSDSERVRMSAAEKLARYWLEQRAQKAPSDPYTDRFAFLAHLEEMNDADLQQYLADLVRRIHADGDQRAMADPPVPAGSD